MSGNGVRIAARWLAAETGSTEVTIETAGRRVAARMLNTLDTDTDVGEFSVGEPELLDGIELTTASVGNPHAVIRLDEPTRDDLLRLGPLFETHARFPERTNVQLVRVDGRHDLTVLVWERGAGETSASGSSSVAAAAVAVERGWCDSPVTVHLPGGTSRWGSRTGGHRCKARPNASPGAPRSCSPRAGKGSDAGSRSSQRPDPPAFDHHTVASLRRGW